MNFAQKMDSVWNGLDEEERDGWLEDARDLAQQENAELRKLGYDEDSDEWIGPEGVLENAKRTRIRALSPRTCRSRRTTPSGQRRTRSPTPQ